MTMSQTERRELRSVIRTQFKVLRAEVKQREAELLAEAATQVQHRYAEVDKQVDDLNWRIAQIVDQANKDIRELIYQAQQESDGEPGKWSWAGHNGTLHPPAVKHVVEGKFALNDAMVRGVAATAGDALLKLERQEADLLRRLAIGALESREARRFLATIPTVGELVPKNRLAEIEAAFDADQE